jgi:mRNA-degrading endonuclease RelE of RelBE toxin-antitoxin system
MEQNFQISATAEKMIRQLESPDRQKLKRALQKANHLPDNAHQLRGYENGWVVRSGNLRLLFTKHNDTWILTSIYDTSKLNPAA